MQTTPQENAALVRRLLTDGLENGDTAAIDTLLTTDAVHHRPVFGERGQPATATAGRVLAGADVAVDIDAVVADRERVAVRATVTGTHTESLMDLAPTGSTFAIAAAWFCRIQNGRIAEIWTLPDGLGVLHQLGALPDPSEHRPSAHRSSQSDTSFNDIP